MLNRAPPASSWQMSGYVSQPGAPRARTLDGRMRFSFMWKVRSNGQRNTKTILQNALVLFCQSTSFLCERKGQAYSIHKIILPFLMCLKLMKNESSMRHANISFETHGICWESKMDLCLPPHVSLCSIPIGIRVSVRVSVQKGARSGQWGRKIQELICQKVFQADFPPIYSECGPQKAREEM